MTELSHAELAQLTWLTTAQAAKFTGLSRETLKRAAASGELKSSQAMTGGWYRFHREWLDAWMTGRSARAAS
jgi:excisionase family DNA binding protein